MSLLNKASLIQIPSGYKDGTLYSAKPTNGDGDFTFSRGSNLAATRVNSEGLIEKGRENLLLQSNSFDTTWNNVNVTLTSGQAGYDGTNNAWKLVGSTSNVSHNVNQGFSVSGVVTLSVYVKPSGYDYMLLYAGSYGGTFFDIANGTTGNNLSNTPIDANIESVGSGWYRVSISVNNANDIGIFASPDGTNFVYSGDGTSGILIQDAQLEVGLVSTDVITTTTTTAQAGILEDMPRLDYSGGASCPSLLLEPQRSNLVTQSEYFDSWTKLNAPTVTTNIAISPDGNLNASGIQDTDGTNFKRVSQSVSVTSNSTVTASIFVKKETNETNYGGLVLDFTGGTRNVFYIIMDSVNGVANNSTSSTSSCTISVTSFNDNWWELVVTATDAGSNTNLAYQYFATIATNSTGGIGIGVGSVRTIYGAMLEEGSYPTSYIPTYGSSVTRGGEILQINGMSNNLASGVSSATLFMDFEFQKEILADALTFRSSTSALGRGYLYDVRMGMADSYGNSITLTQNTQQKCIWRLNTLSNATVFANGTQGNTRSGNAWSDVDTIDLIGGRWSMKIKQITLFNEALTDAECIELTTL